MAAFSALVLAGIAASPAAHAQGFFLFSQPSPRDVVDRLSDEGYSVHLPMIRRGDVYVVDAIGPSRRAARLIVSARDGHVLERYAAAPRWSEDRPRYSRWRDDEADRAPYDDPNTQNERHARTALGDSGPSRLYDHESDFGARPVPPTSLTDEPTRRHAKKHAPDAAPRPEPSVAAVAPSQPKVDVQPAPKIIEVPQAKATATPEPKVEAKPEPRPDSKPAPEAAPAPTQANIEERPAPRVIPLTKPAPAPSSPAKADQAPAPKPPVQAKAEPKPDAPKLDAPKPDAPRKRLNDLPVGTLD